MVFLGIRWSPMVTLATFGPLRVTDFPYNIYRVGSKGDHRSQGDQNRGVKIINKSHFKINGYNYFGFGGEE